MGGTIDNRRQRDQILSSYLGLYFMLLSFSTLRLSGVRGFAVRRLDKPIRSRAFTSKCSLRSTLTDTGSSQSSLILPKHVGAWLDVELPEGRCMGVTMNDLADSDPDAITSENLAIPNHWAHSTYHPDEIDYGLQLHPATSSSFWIGRLAMRLALDFPDYAILKDSHGRPQLAPGICGSISHKLNSGIALVSSDVSNSSTSISASPKLAGVGVDLEMTSRPGKRSIAPRVLTDNERNSLGCIPGISCEEEVLLRFSLKEAIYKASHPLLCQYVGFKEAEVTPHADGTATCVWFLESQAQERIANLTAHWRKLDDDRFFLTSASVQRSSER